MKMSHVLWAGALVLATALAWQGYRAVRAYRIEVLTLYPPRHPVVAPSDSDRLGLIDVTLVSRDSTRMKGWYVPSTNGAAIVMVHGSGSDRSSILPELKSFAKAGFGVLAFDLPGHGESEGDVRIGQPQTDAVIAAVDFVAARADVHDNRIGAAGFSWGGASVAPAAASDCRIRAVAIVATPADPVAQTHSEYARYGRAAEFGAFAVYWLRGIDLAAVRPIDYVGRISPRPLLIVGSPDDTTVPLGEVQSLFAAARQPKELMLTQGTHLRFADDDPQYLPRLAQFFENSLREPQIVSNCPK